jgi:hypothetical protein
LSDPPAKRRHLLISGTGRSGTSFLVRYLTGLGLDTTLARQGEGAAWDPNANAGLEELPVADAANWPYVVKTPWLHALIDQLLADPVIAIDAVIVPMRPLAEVAASRVILELRALHAAHPWLASNERPWAEGWATAGGCLMPLEPLDQARLLAVGFFQLVERLVRAEIPVVFLAFPRLAADPDYLFARLAALLPGIATDRAREVHARLADPALVRVGDELRPVPMGDGPAMPDLATLDGIALRRELVRIRGQLAAAEARATAAGEQARELADRNRALADEISRTGAAHRAVLGSYSWRITAPLRGVRRLLPPRSG